MTKRIICTNPNVRMLMFCTSDIILNGERLGNHVFPGFFVVGTEIANKNSDKLSSFY